jgi:hypothetical protein
MKLFGIIIVGFDVTDQLPIRFFAFVHKSKHLSDNFPIQNGLIQGDALSPMFFNFALEYAIRKVEENQAGLKLNRRHRLLVYDDDMNLLGVT